MTSWKIKVALWNQLLSDATQNTNDNLEEPWHYFSQWRCVYFLCLAPSLSIQLGTAEGVCPNPLNCEIHKTNQLLGADLLVFKGSGFNLGLSAYSYICQALVNTVGVGYKAMKKPVVSNHFALGGPYAKLGWK